MNAAELAGASVDAADLALVKDSALDDTIIEIYIRQLPYLEVGFSERTVFELYAIQLGKPKVGNIEFASTECHIVEAGSTQVDA